MMKQQGHRFLIFTILVLLAFSAAAPSMAKRNKKQKKAKVVQPADTLSYEDSRRYAYFFLEAVRQQEAGHFAAAYDLVNHCIDINPNAAEAYYVRSKYYATLDKDSLALQDLEKAARLNPSNDTYLESVAQLYIGTGNFQQAVDAYERLFAAHRNRDDVLAILIQLYRQQRDYKGMLGAINRLEQLDGTSDQLSLMRMNTYEQMGDSKNAYNTLKALADSHPNDVSFSLMLGNWLMQHNRKDEAFSNYTKVMKAEPDNALAQSAMYDYYQATRQDSLADGMMQRILLGKNTPSQTRVQFFRKAIQENEQHGADSTQIISLLGRMQAEMPKDTTVAQMRVAYYSLKEMPEDSVNNALTNLLSLQPDNASARLQLIQNHWDGNDWQMIDSLSEPGMLYNPKEMVFYFFTGLARYYLKDNDGALDVLQRGKAEITDNSSPDMVANLYSIIGEIYHDKGLNDQAYAAYDSCLQWKPNDTMTLNNYAYFLSVDGKNLKKAEEMSAKTVKAEPKNATFLDTYAWILYKEERYAEAKIYIDLALSNLSDSTRDSTSSGTLFEHAGDIYVGLKDYPAAISYYEQALKHGGDEKAIRRKINLYRKQK